MTLFSINCSPFKVPRLYRGGWTLVVIYFLFISNPHASEELLINAGFNGNYINGVAENWRDNSSWADVDVEYSLSNDAVKGTSQHISAKRITSGAVQFVQQGVSLTKGQTYQISIWMKGKIESPVEVMLRKRGSPYTIYASKAFRISEKWTRYRFIVTSSVDAPGMYFMVRFTGKGDLWLDQASIQKLAPPDATVALKTGNLISNGSFEVGLDHWAVKVRSEGGYQYEMPVQFADDRPAIITGDVPDRHKALQISPPPHGRAIVTTLISDIIPGRRYTLSLWLKSKQPHSKIGVTLSKGWGDRARLGKTFVVNQKWARYKFSAFLPDNHYDLVIQTREPSNELWIDKVQLVAGKSKPFQPRKPVEIGFTRSDKIPLFYKNESIKQEFCIASYQPLNGVFKVEVTSTDFYGKKSLLLDKQFSFNAAKNVCQTFSHPADRTGYFQLQAKILRPDGTVIDRSTMAIGIVPKLTEVPGASSPFGGHATFSPVSLNAVKMLGVSWLRMHPPLGTKWFIVEPEKNHFHFIDRPVQYAKKLGFHILGSLDSTPRWASTAPSRFHNEQSQGYRAYPPKNISDWTQYVSKTVAHYKGTIDDWEIWNEPDTSGFFKLNSPFVELRRPDAYVELVKSAYNAAKQANQHAVIVAGAGTRKPPSIWVSKLINAGILNYMDVLSFHFYTDGRPGDALDVTAGERVNEIRALLKAHGKPDMPIWETESGYRLTICDSNSEINNNIHCASPAASVAFVVRNYVEWIGSGVKHWFFYNMFFPDRTDRPDFSSFFGWDRSPTALAIAYAVCSHLLTGMDFSHKLHVSANISGALFTASNRHVRVLWRKKQNEKNTQIISIGTNPDARHVDVIDAMGNVIVKSDAGANISIAVNIDPVYIVEYF